MSISEDNFERLNVDRVERAQNATSRIQLPNRPGLKRSESMDNETTSRPSFSYANIIVPLPIGSVLLDDSTRQGTRVRILSMNGGTRIQYHILPWEFSLPAPILERIGLAIRKVRCEPPNDVISDVAQLRAHVRQQATKFLQDQPRRPKDPTELPVMVEQLAEVVARYTIGLGVLEHFFSDDRVEDIYLDAPNQENRWHITISGVTGSHHTVRAQTNILALEQEAVGLVSRLRQYSLKPFSEAIPVMETDVPGFDARATVMGRPMSPHGLALAFRRHSRRPWTLLRLAQHGSLSVRTAALLSFLIDGRSSMLVCGPRGAGKSSLLSALMFAIEDTLELPVRQMQQLGFKVQSIHVVPGLDRSIDQANDDALRVSLRLGESALVVGEVRGREAATLYESMRTGKAGSSVLGTIHGDSARSVYERAVHDLGVAPEAFGATDVVLTLGLIRPNGAQRQERRLVEVAETDRSSGPGNFIEMLDEFQMNARPRQRFAVIGRIAKEWGLSYEEALDNIQARTDLRQMILDAQARTSKDLLGPERTCQVNEFLWARMDQGITGQGDILDGFNDIVRDWC
jgi:flagellar protein FlaI